MDWFYIFKMFKWAHLNSLMTKRVLCIFVAYTSNHVCRMVLNKYLALMHLESNR